LRDDRKVLRERGRGDPQVVDVQAPSGLGEVYAQPRPRRGDALVDAEQLEVDGRLERGEPTRARVSTSRAASTPTCSSATVTVEIATSCGSRSESSGRPLSLATKTLVSELW
jgi:hypothetical protein